MMNRTYGPQSWALGTSLNGPLDLKEIKDAGLDCIEIVLSHKRFHHHTRKAKQYYSDIVAKANKLGLQIWSVHLPYGNEWDISVLDVQEKERILKAHHDLLMWAAQYGVRHAVIHPSYEPIAAEERKDRLAVCRTSLEILAQHSAEVDIQLAVECLPRTCLGNTSGEMVELLRDNRYAGVCCDVNHLMQEKPESFIQKLGQHVKTLHISDNDGVDERHWMPGNGVINWRNVMQSLTDIGYDGPFMFEVKNPDPQEIIQCWNHLLQESEQC